jgi:hypothetical protein
MQAEKKQSRNSHKVKTFHTCVCITSKYIGKKTAPAHPPSADAFCDSDLNCMHRCCTKRFSSTCFDVVSVTLRRVNGCTYILPQRIHVYRSARQTIRVYCAPPSSHLIIPRTTIISQIEELREYLHDGNIVGSICHSRPKTISTPASHVFRRPSKLYLMSDCLC